jgi:hypothetical protein
MPSADPFTIHLAGLSPSRTSAVKGPETGIWEMTYRPADRREIAFAQAMCPVPFGDTSSSRIQGITSLCSRRLGDMAVGPDQRFK